MAPAPLRARGFRVAAVEGAGALVPSERRYRGEGFLEPRGSGVGLYSHAASTVGTGGTPLPSVNENRSTPLEQQVLRLQDGGPAGGGTTGFDIGTVAVVRVVLEPLPAKRCDCEGAPHPGNNGQEDGKNGSCPINEKCCEVRGVLRVEAYLPSSSTTLTLRVKVPSTTTSACRRGESDTPAAAAAAAAESGSDAVGESIQPLVAVNIISTTRSRTDAETEAAAGNGRTLHGAAGESEGRRSDGQLLLVSGAGHAAECRSRKQQRRALREARDAEARRGYAEMSAAVEEASTCVPPSNTHALPRKKEAIRAGVAATSQRPGRPDSRADDGPPKLKPAFSMLLVRANAVVPIRPLNLASGSWREAIGEMVGCPPGQELRKVMGHVAMQT